MRTRGYSLVEMMVALGLFFGAMLVAFSLFERGTRAFGLGDAQSNSAGDARRTLLAIAPDLRLGDLDTLAVLPRTASDASGATVGRHGLCLATLSRWDRPENFNLVQAGIYWDGYTVLYATRQPLGQLVKQVYRPGPGPFSGPWSGFSEAACMSDNYRSNPSVFRTQVLSQNVQAFDTEVNEETATLELRLQLADRGARKSGGRARDQRTQASLRVRLENTAPN